MIRTGRILALTLAALICLGGCSTAVDRPPVDRPPVDSPAGPAAGNRTAELRDAAVRVAEQTAVAVASLDHRDGDADYDRLLALLSGAARQEWEQQRAEKLAALTSDAVTADRVAVKASGVAALDPAAPSATVLVAATARIAGKQAPAPEEHRYRLRMSLTRTADEWKVSELQFVS